MVYPPLFHGRGCDVSRSTILHIRELTFDSYAKCVMEVMPMAERLSGEQSRWKLHHEYHKGLSTYDK